LRCRNGLNSATLAAIANPGMSSWAALTKRAGFLTGENLLILGATGVAGQLAIQIAKHLGARRVVAAGRNRKALERSAELGADAIVPLDQERESLVSSSEANGRRQGSMLCLTTSGACQPKPRCRPSRNPSRSNLCRASIRPSRRLCRQDHSASGCGSTQLGYRTPGQWVRKRIHQRALSGGCGFLSVRGKTTTEGRHQPCSVSRRGSALDFGRATRTIRFLAVITAGPITSHSRG
jgi:threonine dehydrogenase-like Zn-dependent dehydrogenase